MTDARTEILTRIRTALDDRDTPPVPSLDTPPPAAPPDAGRAASRSW